MILSLSGRLPLLVAMLAESSPNDPTLVSDPNDKAVERFLKWETDPNRRQVAIDAALPRCLNQDVLNCLCPDDGVKELFSWLRQKPFVKERTDGWVYHEVVRTQMLRHKKRVSPQDWGTLQGKLAEYYETQRTALQINPEKAQRDPDWQSHTLNLLYHRLCQSPQQHLSIALNEFLAALKNQRRFAERWAETMQQAGQDTGAAELRSWGERLVKGLSAYDEDRYEVTIVMFSSLVEYSEIDAQWRPVAYGWRGEVYRLMKRYEEALQDFNRSIELDPEYSWAIASRGQVYQSMNQYGEALQDFNRAIELDPNSAWKIAERGQVYRLMERYEEALQNFNRSIELNSEYGWAIALRGETYRLMKRYEEALQDFNRSIELDPEYSWAIASRGQVYQSLNQYGEALQDFNRAIELDPNSAWAIARRGQVYRLMERYEEALQNFNRSIELNPEYSWAIARRGQVCRAIARYEEALQDFNRAIELNPEYSRAIARRGETYRLMARYEEALQDFNRAIELDSEYSWAIALRGEIYRLMARYEEALQDFNCTIELNPEYSWAIARRGQVCRAIARYEEALQDFNRAIELNPEYSRAIARRGETYRLMARYEEALQDFNRAIGLNPNSGWRLYDRAITYQALGQPEPAKADLTQAISIAQSTHQQDPQNWRNTFNLALYHVAANQPDRAKHFYRDALQRNAPIPRIQAAIQDLADFLKVFSDHAFARSMQQALQKRLEKLRSTPVA